MDEFISGARSVLGDVIEGVSGFLTAREQSRANARQAETAAVAGAALKEHDTNQLRIVAFAVVGIAAVWMLMKRR